MWPWVRKVSVEEPAGTSARLCAAIVSKRGGTASLLCPQDLASVLEPLVSVTGPVFAQQQAAAGSGF